MTQNINGPLMKNMVINAAAAISNHKQEINELNVFPVPDGDTGTNMSLTMSAAEKALETLTAEAISRVADEVAGATLRGARGNSGVILSLLFRGFSRSVKDENSADAKAFAGALTAGVDAAYKAVMKPTEGTILTVSRLAAAAAVECAEREKDIEKVIQHALDEGHIALAKTISQNPVLQKAGVIDAGAKGYLYMLSGMLSALRGEVIEKEDSDTQSEEKADFSQYSAEDIEFAYCTELMVERETKKNPNDLRDFLDKHGDSIVVIDDDEVIKIHVHTNDPGVAITEALKYGPLLTSKIENMRMQHSEAVHQSENAGGKVEDSVPTTPEDMKEYAIVTVCVGEGIEEIFKELGVDRIIAGGQTMNPSTEDILKKIIDAPSNTVFVLPNNKNIILAAEQCIPLTEKRVIVVPSKTVPQGVAAMMSMSIDGVEDIEELAAKMREAIGKVHTSHVTRAVRDSKFDGQDLKEGEYLALLEDSIIESGSDADVIISAIASAFKKIVPEFVTIYYGCEITEKEAEEAAEKIGSVLSDSEVLLVAGGQPIYHYIISAE